MRIAPSLQQARILNLKKYQDTICERNPAHGRIKYRSTQECVGCVRARGSKKRARIKADMIADTKAEAMRTGQIYYRGIRCYKEGHGNIKYRTNTRCIFCKWEDDAKAKVIIAKPVIVENPITKETERLAYNQRWRG